MKLVMFELFEKLDAGQTAKAYLLQWNGRRVCVTGPTIILHDFVANTGSPETAAIAFSQKYLASGGRVSGLFTQECSRLG